jgi:hypothetical protein
MCVVATMLFLSSSALGSGVFQQIALHAVRECPENVQRAPK